MGSQEKVSKTEFSLEDEYPYNRTGPVRWIISHALRYPILPLSLLLAAAGNNLAYGYIQIFIGRSFDLITSVDWTRADLTVAALAISGAALSLGFTGLIRNYASEFMAQAIERDTRHELYVSLLGKSQTFHGRQRVGDIMSRATNDVSSLNLMFSPGMMLITDSIMSLVIPIVLIGLIRAELLIVPLMLTVALVLTLLDYNRRLSLTRADFEIFLSSAVKSRHDTGPCWPSPYFGQLASSMRLPSGMQVASPLARSSPS
jgi:ATP-binding cassette subfamily B protein